MTYVAEKLYCVLMISITLFRDLFSSRYSCRMVSLCLAHSPFVVPRQVCSGSAVEALEDVPEERAAGGGGGMAAGSCSSCVAQPA